LRHTIAPMVKNRSILLFIFLLFTTASAFAGGVKGFIKDENNQALGFATIYVRNLKTGTTSNDEGYFEINLAPGKYDLVFQYLGYETLIKTVDIGSDFIELSIILKSISIQLESVEIDGGAEDPAYTVMRKAIAKADYHRQQLDSYSARVYIKGSGRVLSVPFFLRKTLAKEGIDSSMAFVSESVIEVTYTRPNIYEQKVISLRESGSDNNSSPNGYIFGSFYEPKIGESISPLSTRAFAYYRFRYEGSFIDRGFTVDKIKVVPRSKGDNVFEGYIFIIEDLWSIYNLDLTTYIYGIKFNIKQVYNPVEKNVWMPVNHQFVISGKFYGLEFVYNYLATVSNYQVTLNPDLDYNVNLIDEKIEKERSKELEKTKKDTLFDPGKEITRKQFRKMIKEYEKEEDKKQNTENIEINSNYSVDSLANKKDSVYWMKTRPIPLNQYEVKGYRKMDSVLVVQNEKEAKDSLKNNKKFKWYDIILGGGYKLDEHNHFRIYNMLEINNFNTVDGFLLGYKVKYTYKFDDDKKIFLAPEIHYAFSRKAVNYQAQVGYSFGKGIHNGKLTLTGGRMTSQINSNNPIHPYNNAFTTLFLERNYMKIYERNFVSLHFEKNIFNKWKVMINTSYAQRKELENNSDYTFFNWKNREFTSNQPENVELENTGFPIHQAFISNVSAEYRPWLKFRIRNNKKYVIESSSPTFSFTYTNAAPIGNSTIDFNLLDIGAKLNTSIGARGKLGLNVHGGIFLSDSKLYFPDYRHFMGNLSPLTTLDPASGYRLLPSYFYSTTGAYLTGFANFQFRKLLLTQITVLRFAGLKENLFLNYLATDNSKNYFELGYGLDNIFRFFRIEAVASFQDGKYLDFGLRIGISTVLLGQ